MISINDSFRNSYIKFGFNYSNHNVEKMQTDEILAGVIHQGLTSSDFAANRTVSANRGIFWRGSPAHHKTHPRHVRKSPVSIRRTIMPVSAKFENTHYSIALPATPHKGATTATTIFDRDERTITDDAQGIPSNFKHTFRFACVQS